MVSSDKEPNVHPPVPYEFSNLSESEFGLHVVLVLTHATHGQNSSNASLLQLMNAWDTSFSNFLERSIDVQNFEDKLKIFKILKT